MTSFLEGEGGGDTPRGRRIKLLEIQERKRLLRRGNAVLDLGCRPGSWLQVAAELVGDDGVVVGIDLTPVTIDLPGMTTLVGDAFKSDASVLLLGDESRRFDVVMSDMAPEYVRAW